MLCHRLLDQHIDFGFNLILDNNVCIDVIIQNYELICDLSIFVFSRLRTRTTAMVDSTFGKLIIRLRELCSMQIRKELLVWERIHQCYLNEMHSQTRFLNSWMWLNRKTFQAYITISIGLQHTWWMWLVKLKLKYENLGSKICINEGNMHSILYFPEWERNARLK